MSEVSEQEVHAVAAALGPHVPVGFDPSKIIPVIQDLTALWSDVAFRKFLTDLAALFGLPVLPGPAPTPNPAPTPTP